MKADKFKIVVLGEPMVEFNQMDSGNEHCFVQGYGGDTSNFAIAAARQGASVAYISAIGDDSYGSLLRKLWDSEGVNHSYVKTDSTAYTGIYFVTHDERGHHFSFYRNDSAASRMRPADLPFKIINSACVLHLSGITLAISNNSCDTAYEAVAQARKAGVLVSFDTNLRPKLWSIGRARAITNDFIANCDICLPSYEDIVAITGIREPDALVDHCLRLGAKIVALKLGADGALVANATHRHRIAPRPSKLVDATGAGDTFGGAFVARLVAGDDLFKAARYAVVAAGLSTEDFGAIAPIPRAQQVRIALGEEA